MKLITFQSYDALKFLINNGYLICDEKHINKNKVGKIYDWVVEKMNQQVINTENIKYPMWAWVKCYNGICPPKRKGLPVKNFDVKITFHKKETDVFITDFRLYSFLLNNTYIPNHLNEKEAFSKKLSEKKITEDELKAYVRLDKYSSSREDKEFLDICNEIRNSFDRCITKNSDILQGCVWKINLSEVESIEILHPDGYTYGTLNYIRANGERINWINEYYKNLK